jgi:hypothetical protein
VKVCQRSSVAIRPETPGGIITRVRELLALPHRSEHIAAADAVADGAERLERPGMRGVQRRRLRAGSDEVARQLGQARQRTPHAVEDRTEQAGPERHGQRAAGRRHRLAASSPLVSS